MLQCYKCHKHFIDTLIEEDELPCNYISSCSSRNENIWLCHDCQIRVSDQVIKTYNQKASLQKND